MAPNHDKMMGWHFQRMQCSHFQIPSVWSDAAVADAAVAAS